MFRVRVAEDCRWPVVVVAGQQFTREAVEVAEVDAEIAGSPLLEVVEVKPQARRKRRGAAAPAEGKDDQNGED